jgi:hypothetical protein
MAKSKPVTFFKTRLEDKPGALQVVANQLKAKNVGLTALWAYATQMGEAQMYCIPKDVERFRNFAKAQGLSIEEGNGFFLKGSDRTGALVKPLDAIAKAGINIVALHSLAAGGNYGAFLQVAPADIEKTGKVLGA